MFFSTKVVAKEHWNEIKNALLNDSLFTEVISENSGQMSVNQISHKNKPRVISPWAFLFLHFCRQHYIDTLRKEEYLIYG